MIKTKMMLLCLLFVQTISLTQFKNIRVSTQDARDPEEPAIAINYFNQSQIAAASNIMYFYGSDNGGNSWNQSIVTSSMGVWGDPSLVYDTKGNLFFAHLSYPQDGKWLDRIVVQKSTDNGKTWNDGVGIGKREVPKIEDKEWITADITDSPFRDNLYMCWTERDKFSSSDPNDSSRILFSKSTNSGESWFDPKKINDISGLCNDDDNTVEGAVPAVGPDGQIYVAWAGPLGIVFDKSYDAGETWGRDIFVNEMPGGWDFNIEGLQWGNGMPVTVCDISNTATRGTIYIMWGDTRNGELNHDIFLSRSTDEGETWSEPIKVNDDNTERSQFFGWIAIDQTTGFIYISFYDRRNTTGTDTDYYLARSVDGGISFTNHKINENTFTPTTDKFFGDYSNIVAYNGRIYPIWNQMTNGELSIWMSIINDDELITDIEEGVTRIFSGYRLNQNYPNPFNPTTYISFELVKASNVKLVIYDISGKKVKTLLDGPFAQGRYYVEFSDKNLSSGIYFYKLIAGKFIETKKMILSK
jgi:hypothetical protein